MKYVHVVKNSTPFTPTLDIIPSVLKHTNNLLISLQEAFGKKGLSRKSVEMFQTHVQTLRTRYNDPPVNIWIDSGGYSFICGKLGVENVDTLISLYGLFLDSPAYFDKIFSLDLPFNAKHESFNNITSIKSANRKSLESSIHRLQSDDELSRKFYFVTHFLRGNSYAIWRELYNELDLGSIVKNRALGGMVGARGSKRQLPSPFTGVAYRALIDYLDSPKQIRQEVFSLHFLGINTVQDRFQIIVLEELFQKYSANLKTDFSYDTAHYSVQVKYAHQTLPIYILGKRIGFYFENRYESLGEDVIAKIYHSSNVQFAAKKIAGLEKKRVLKLHKSLSKFFAADSPVEGRQKRGKSGQLEIFDPIHIYSNINLDKFLRNVIIKYNVTELFVQSQTLTEFKSSLQELIFNMSDCDSSRERAKVDQDAWLEATVFARYDLLLCIWNGLVETYKFHRWYVDDRANERKLDEMIVECSKAFQKNEVL